MGKTKVKTIIYLGFSQFPFGFATGERQKLISRALIDNGFNVVILARKGSLKNTSIHLPHKGTIDGIQYHYANGSIYRPNSFLIRNLMKLYGIFMELFLIALLCYKNQVNYVILHSRSIRLQKYYFILSRIFHFKIIIDYTERASVWAEIDASMNRFEKNSPFLTDAAICISNNLIETVKDINPNLPLYKVPAICDIQHIHEFKPSLASQPYFLFCGTLFYREVIETIVESFLACTIPGIQLYLVVNGNKSEYDQLQEYIANKPRFNYIKIFSNLEYAELIGLYKGAQALLIPLRPTLQDTARFPHKIGEYCASGRPIISTNQGEIPFYFKDMENVLLATSYDPEAIGEKMEWVLLHPEEATAIGVNGSKVAATNFDFRAIGKGLAEFLKSL